MERLGQYDLEQQVAQGSTGVVFRGRHVELHSLAAIKVLRPELAADPAVAGRFRQEGRTLAGLDHPGIVRVLDLGADGDRLWIALDWIDGAPLDDVLAARGTLSAEQAVGVLREALQGLAEAHRRQVVHGDVATSNILLSTAGSSMLVDFGLACPVGATGVCGTPAFVSPEAAASGALTPRSDVWSAAAVLHLLLTGTPVLPAAEVDEVLRRHRDEPAPALTGHGPDLAAVLGKALAHDPGGRYPEAGAFLRALEEAAERHFGAGWLARASVAGLSVGVGATGTGGSAAVATTGATDTTASIDTGTIETATPEASPAPHPHPRRLRLPKTPAALVAVAVVAVATIGTTTAVLTTTGGSSRTPTGSKVPKVFPTAFPNDLPTDKGTVVTDPGALPVDSVDGTSSQDLFITRVHCTDGRTVTSATASLTRGGTTAVLPMTYLGTDVWSADLSGVPGPDDQGAELAGGTCGDTAPEPQPDPAYQANMSVELPPDPNGTLTVLRLVAKADPRIPACPFGAPVASFNWVHGFVANSASDTFTGGYPLSQQPGMTTTPMTAAGDGTFYYDISRNEYDAQSTGDQPGKTYTETWFGSCDFTKTPPYVDPNATGVPVVG